MRTARHRKKYLTTLACLVGLSMLFWLMMITNQTARKNTSQHTVGHTAGTTAIASANAGWPMRLKIPSLKLEAEISAVGLTSAGQMDAPSRPSIVGWYKDGPRPGDTGKAVIGGHYGTWQSGEKSVFDKLHTLQVGSEVVVQDSQGRHIVFIVRRSQSFEPGIDTTDIFKATDGKAHLNLITCEGQWNAKSETYAKRLVVFTDRKE